jgi:hypothetical protein
MNNYNAGSVLYNLVFRNCVIGTNTGSGNGVKIIDYGQGGVHDITFDHCHFAYQPRMGIEVIGRSLENGRGGQGYLRVHVTNCTFDASAGEAISYDANPGDNAGYCTVSGCVVEGAGVGSSYQYGKVIENNGTLNMTWTNNYVGAGRDGIVNINGRGDELGALNMVASGNVYDAFHVPAGVTTNNQVFNITSCFHGGVTFSDLIINDPNGYSGAWGYLDKNSGLNFGGSTIKNGTPSGVYGGNNTNMIWPKQG